MATALANPVFTTSDGWDVTTRRVAEYVFLAALVSVAGAMVMAVVGIILIGSVGVILLTEVSKIIWEESVVVIAVTLAVIWLLIWLDLVSAGRGGRRHLKKHQEEWKEANDEAAKIVDLLGSHAIK